MIENRKVMKLNKLLLTLPANVFFTSKYLDKFGITSAYKVKEQFPDIKILRPSLIKEEKKERGLSDFNDLEKVRGGKE